MTRNQRLLVAPFAVGILALGACGGNEPARAPSTPQAGGTTSVAVTVKEWSVLPGQASARAGSVTFTVTNDGPDQEHEFVVVKTDLGADSLPTKTDGTVDEMGAGVQSIGEIEEFAVGTSQSKTFTLTAGRYVLFCNVLEEQAPPNTGGIKAHFKLGMFAGFTAT